jgi:hypothetical protein
MRLWPGSHWGARIFSGIDLQLDDKGKISGAGPLETRYGPGSGAMFRRMRRPPATSIAEFETNTGK